MSDSEDSNKSDGKPGSNSAQERLQILKLTQKRNALVMNAKKVYKEVDELLQQDDPDAAEMSKCLGKLTDYRNRLSDIGDTLLSLLIKEEDVENEVQKATEVDDQLLEYIESLKSTSVKAASVVRSSLKNADFASASEHESSVKKRVKVKLPKLEIDKFSGNPMEWQSFWDSFSSTIDENEDLSDVDKFKYLISYLSDDALGVTKGYTLTSANYGQVVEALKDRFGNPQLAVFSHLTAMIDLQPSASYDVTSLQKIYDECERHIRSLAALGLEQSTFGQVFTPIILSKLPTYVRMELHRKNGHQVWTLTNLRSMLKDEIRARDMSMRQFDEKDTKSRQPPSKKGGSDRKTDNSLTVSGKGKKKDGKQKTCVYCGKPHFADECTKFPDAKSRKEKIKGQRFNCFSKKHIAKECPVPKRPCVYCQRTGHNRSLCDEKFTQAGEDRKPVNSVPASSLNPSAAPFLPAPANVNYSTCVNLQTAVVEICDSKQKRKCKARILFDTASSKTFISASKAEALSLPTVETEPMSIAGFEQSKRRQVYRVVEFDIVLLDGKTQRVSARVTPTITCPVWKEAINFRQFPYMQNLPLAEPHNDRSELMNIDILLGGDYYKIVTDEIIRSSQGLVLLSSKVGYITAGTTPCNADHVKSAHVALHVNAVNDTHFDLQKFWKLEELGITDSPKKSAGDKEALLRFQKTTKFKNGRYEVSLPWKSDRPELPDHHIMCRCRLKSLLTRMKDSPETMEKYAKIMNDQVKLGIIEQAPVICDGPVHYMPHHCVLKPDSATTKVRVVYDASAKTSVNGISLNDSLHRGPVIIADLCGLLLRFRLHGVAVVSDIEKAYHQLSVKPSDRDAMRFLWVKDIRKPVTTDNLLIYRFARVPFGVISSAFLLDATVRHHIKQITATSKVAKLTSDHLYMDNIIVSFPKDSLESKWYAESKLMLSTASMNLREFFSNSEKLMKNVPSEDKGSGNTKVLGLSWDIKNDTLACQCKIPADELIAPTKRIILSRIAAMYDPCGFFSPVEVPAKLLMRELWVNNLEWDDEVSTDIQSKWESIRQELLKIPNLKIPRHVSVLADLPDAKFQLHCFCDASSHAYAAAVYLRIEDSGGNVDVNLLFSKSRVRPPEAVTIPKLELLGATIGASMMDFVEIHLHLPIQAKFLWCDAQCVLHWIYSDQKATVFVANRVKKIRAVKGLKASYVPTDLNPADLATRGCSADEIQNSDIWWHGPAFLKGPCENWPRFDVRGRTEMDMPEHVGQRKDTHDESVVALASYQSNSFVCPIDFSRFSKLSKLRRVAAWLLRFIHNCRKLPKRSGLLTAEELTQATSMLDGQMQRSIFKGNIKDIMPGLSAKRLSLFKDDQGLIRCRSRLDHSALVATNKHPVLLPRKNHYTGLVIKECHERAGHAGTSQTLAKVGEAYWIPSGRLEVKSVINRCLLCRRLEGGPYKVPNQPPLPSFRVSGKEPFACVGIYYLGPIYVKHESGVDKKVWILLLFTCAVIRAVHLEVVDDMTTREFLMAFHRFVALYGTPKLIISDNAKQFKSALLAAKKIWQNVLIDEKVQNFAAENGMKWKFITEKAPWMGGFYERLVGLVKRALRRSLFNRRVFFSEIQTLTAEAAAMVNSRPLVCQDDDLSNHPLTPAHFLLKGGSRRFLTDQTFEDEYLEKKTTPDTLCDEYRKVRSMLDGFWKIFASEYLRNLKERSPPKAQRNACLNVPSLGEVVLVKDKNAKRSNWKLGKVVMLFESTDGQCRSATVKFSSGTTVRRPIKLLYPLECSASSNNASSDVPLQPADASRHGTSQGRPKRNTAVQARERIRQLAAEEADQSTE